ncbi:MAG: HPr kinase/phosphatase C-terminal domain-containing protein [Proteobacteria bacterium]|nr:HPr kinase/phosphatase C-terminal domain-containing protein [Pseudomonadota bacterium]MDA1356062.1 HPr kinase/phosphatase C-terminal domain-containing protein [Pseudomonadota bacterium]
MQISHATCVALAGQGVLLRGPSGAGKSDLALRLIDGGGALVADDQVLCQPEDGTLFAAPPPALAGLIEIRGIGLMQLHYLPRVALVLVADLVPADQIERLPPPARCTIEGIELPRIAVMPFEASAPAKLRMTCAMLARGEALVEDLAPRLARPA